MTQAEMHKSDRLKRVAFMALRVVGIIAAVVAISVGSLMIVLQTRWGGDRVRRQVVARVNQQIQGQLGIGRLSFGGNRLQVWDVTLRDPAGQLVAQVARAEVDFRIARLLHKEVRVTAVTIESPHLAAVSDADGLDLSRAVAPRKKTPPRPPTPKTLDEGWVIRLDRFELSDGDVRIAAASATTRKETMHITNLRSFLSVRYATGNGSTDLTFRLDGQSTLAPAGPLAIKAEARVRGDATHVAVDGHLLGGTLEARADVDSQRLEAADALLAIAIPRVALGGFDWGPLRVDGRAHPGAIPTLDLLLQIPGVQLTAKGGGPDIFKLEGRLAVADLALTGKAAQALMTGAAPALAGQGTLNLTLAGPLAGAPASWGAGVKGLFDHLRFAENTITDLSIDGRVAHLSATPGEADLRIGVAAVVAGTAKLGQLQLTAQVRQQDVGVEATLATPEAIRLTLKARLDDDRQGLAVSRLALAYPRVEWLSDGVARVRFGDQTMSLKDFRLRSQGQATAREQTQVLTQVLTIDASKDGERIDAHLALSKLRLDLLPALAVDPRMNLGGTLDVDVKADGEISRPRVAARVRLEQGRFRKFSRVRASVDATLADQQVDGTLGAGAPFAVMDGAFHLPVNPLDNGALNLRLDVTRLDLADALRAAAIEPQVDGRLTAHLRVTGNAGSPKVALTINGRELEVKRPTSAPAGPNAIDIGHARIQLTYEDRAAHADIDFASAHGGTLRVDAGARVDLSYPRVTEGIVAKKIPVHGKVVAKDLDVAWISRFNDRVESLGGQVSADAKLAGTVGDPQFIGDVRWKNGKVVATAAPTAPATTPAAKPNARR